MADDYTINLAQAMPEMEVLRLSKTPCHTPHRHHGQRTDWPRLSKLRAHFQIASFVDAGTPSRLDHEPVGWWGVCVLEDLEVGEIPIPGSSALTVTLTLLQIFPSLINIKYINQGWKTVADTIKHCRQILTFVKGSSTAQSVHLAIPIDNALPEVAVCYGRLLRS